MEKDFYISLIYKELKGELSDSELQTLQQFYAESETNRTLRDEIQLSWMMSQEVDENINLDIDVEDDLKKVKTNLNHLPSKEIERKIISMWRRVASIAAILIPLIVGGVFLFQKLNTDSAVILQADNGVKVIDLKDGSKVWLNENSQLELAADFNQSERNVILQGEAFFDIAKNQEKTFNIKTGNITVSVLGTSFNVKENNNQLTVSVISGKVKVESKNDSVILVKNEKVVFEKSNQQFSKTNLSNTNEFSWKTKNFIYKNESLQNVVNQLENIFSKKIEIQNSEIQDCGISFVLNANDFQSVLNKVADAVHCEIKTTETNTYQLIGGECN